MRISFEVLTLDLVKDASQVQFAPHPHTLARGLAKGAQHLSA